MMTSSRILRGVPPPPPVRLEPLQAMPLPPEKDRGEVADSQPAPAQALPCEDAIEPLLQQRLAETREAARLQGFTQGYGEGWEQSRRESAELLQRLQAIVDGAVVDLAAAVKAAESEVVELALAVAERIVERELRTDPSAVRAVVRAALEEIAALPIAQVRVHPDDLALLDTARATVIPPGLDPQIPVVADPHVERGGCIVDTTSGLVDAQPKTRLVEIRQRALALLNGELV
ncbi:MAG TPA: FliH/SctL family protein [Chloroflexota bacterium]